LDDSLSVDFTATEKRQDTENSFLVYRNPMKLTISLSAKFRRRSVGLCPLITNVYCGKTADSIELPFGMVGVVSRVSTGKV